MELLETCKKGFLVKSLFVFCSCFSLNGVQFKRLVGLKPIGTHRRLKAFARIKVFCLSIGNYIRRKILKQVIVPAGVMHYVLKSSTTWSEKQRRLFHTFDVQLNSAQKILKQVIVSSCVEWWPFHILLSNWTLLVLLVFYLENTRLMVKLSLIWSWMQV